ncbi:MAG: DUF4743 domain-containing protein [Neisseriaceae bacterium]|nr:DUF4743 domain-containing protein [Neisseriaceae bacterium]
MKNYQISLAVHDLLLQIFADRFDINLADFVVLQINNVNLGYLNQTFAKHLQQDLSHKLQIQNNTFNLIVNNWQEAADLLQDVAYQWHEKGIYDGWRNEKFAVTHPNGEVLFALERSAFRPLGLLSHAIHINGYIEKNNTLMFWIGKRSPKKVIAPNKLDTLVGGGVANGESIHNAMIREGFEEAGLPENLLNHAEVSGCHMSLRKVHRGLHREYIHIFDHRLPDDFIPQNQDGEVSDFILMNVDEITQQIIANNFMNDAALALLATFNRMGFLLDNHKLTQWINSNNYNIVKQ